MRRNHGCSVRRGVVALSVVLLAYGVCVDSVPAQDSKKFTMINVIFDGTKIWLPSSLIITEGDAVELTLINKLDEPHGFQIAAFGIEEVVQPKAQTTVRFTATKNGIIPFICQMHPPHIGGQILVVKK